MLHPVFGETLSAQRRDEVDVPLRVGLPDAAALHAGHVGHADEITIRLADAGDLASLRRLIEIDAGGAGTRHMLLDLTRPDAPRRVLAAFAGGKAIAALHVDSGHEASDPFEHAATALELLRTRAVQIRGSAPVGAPRRRRRFAARLQALSPR